MWRRRGYRYIPWAEIKMGWVKHLLCKHKCPSRSYFVRVLTRSLSERIMCLDGGDVVV